MSSVLLQSNLPLPLYVRGKVRDVYLLGEQLLIVATDRISAFDCVLPTGIPGKGRILTQLSIFWFHLLEDIVASHLLTARVEDYPDPLPQYREQLEGRSMLVRRAEMVEAECVVRGYLSGSGWKEYRACGAICGIALPPGLKESEKLPEPIFTPATKAVSGHDENIPFERFRQIAGADAERLRELSLAIYRRAADYAAQRGILVADTKLEFGYVNGRLVLADEVLTPDSSRFWPKESYAPGGPQPSYDKQFVRDYLESLSWDKRPPAPPLPEEIVEKTAAKYRQAYRALTGREIE